MNRVVILVVAALLMIPDVTLCAADSRVEQAAEVMKKYELVPKGVVLEGSAEGMEEIKNLSYDREANEFLINGIVHYKNPVSRKEWVQVFKSLTKDDRMGVTLLNGEPRLYGDLNNSGELAAALVSTDKVLGGIIYGLDHLLTDVKLPGDYKPKKAENRKTPVVAFSRLTRYTFEKEGTNYKVTSCSLDINLIPLSEKKTATGGHLPDDEAFKTYSMEDSDRQNIDHIRSHQSEYFKMPQFSKTVALGEAAAFARSVRDSNLLTDELIKQMK